MTTRKLLGPLNGDYVTDGIGNAVPFTSHPIGDDDRLSEIATQVTDLPGVTSTATWGDELNAWLTAKHAGVFNVLDEGADWTGAADVSAATVAGTTAAFAGRRSGYAGIESDARGTRVIDLPAGIYKITELQGLLGQESPSAKVVGLKFRGAGSSLTTVVFDPATAGPLAFNDYWLNLTFEGMSFLAADTGCDFLHSHTTHNAQRYSFVDVSWVGPWRYIVDLQGSNNNSEYTFIRASTSGMAANGAVLHIGSSNTSDQFINYWFYGFTHWSTSAPIIEAHKGGHFHFYGLDVSDYAVGASSFTPIFKLYGNPHAQGVCSMTVQGMRVEGKSAHAALLESEWPQGAVTIQCDWSSQSPSFTYNDIIRIALSNTGGPMYHFHDSVLAGTINVSYGVNIYQHQPRIVVARTQWLQKLTPSEVVVYTDPAAEPSFNNTRPVVRFVDCRGKDNDAFGAGGVSVWDAETGYRGPLVRMARPRQLRVFHFDAGTVRIHLPVGALITALLAFAPAGATSETSGVGWTLATTENTPTTIATVTVATDASLGYSVREELSVPYLCDARNKASVTVVANSVSTYAYNGWLVIEGYW